LLDTLNQLAQKQKEIIKERLHVNTINLAGDQADQYEKRIKELEKQIEELLSKESITNLGPKSSKKETNETSYEATVQKRFTKLMKEVKAGRLDINTITPQDQLVIRQMLENE
jgi:type I site-specific restriction endonuclease